MIVRLDIKQGSEEWLAIKWGKIGGTRSKGLFVDSDTLLHELAGELMEQFEMDYDAYESPDMIRGHQLELMAREQAERYLGLKFNEVGWLQSSECELLGISPDGLSEDCKDALETKCPALKKHTKTIIEDIVPKDYIYQIVHYFTINEKLERLHFCSFRPENEIKPLFIKTVTPDSIYDFGTATKPKPMSIGDMARQARLAGAKLEVELNELLEKLKF